MADAVPHTRPPTVVGSTADRAGPAPGLSAPTYQGVTGLIGALHVELEQRAIPTISLRVGVPHYLGHAEHPLAVGAIVAHLAHVLSVPLTADLQDQIDRWAALHDEAIAGDAQLRTYVRCSRPTTTAAPKPRCAAPTTSPHGSRSSSASRRPTTMCEHSKRN